MKLCPYTCLLIVMLLPNFSACMLTAQRSLGLQGAERLLQCTDRCTLKQLNPEIFKASFVLEVLSPAGNLSYARF